MRFIPVDTKVCPCECGGQHVPTEIVDTKLGINIPAGAIVPHINSEKVWCRCNKCYTSGGFFTVPKDVVVSNEQQEEVLV